MWNIITLGKEGVLKDPVKRLEHVMLCFFFSKHSQSRLFAGKITSLTKILQENTDSPEELKTALQNKIQSYLEGFFPTVSVLVGIEDNDGEDSAMVITMDINVSNVKGSNAPSINVGYALTQQGSHVREILDKINNRKIL